MTNPDSHPSKAEPEQPEGEGSEADRCLECTPARRKAGLFLRKGVHLNGLCNGCRNQGVAEFYARGS